MDKHYGVVYRAVNKINGRVYIGQTTQPLNCRINYHIYSSINSKDNLRFHKAIRKYGEESFTWDIVDVCNSKNSLNELETKIIKKYDSVNNGYNMKYGGADGNCFKHSEEAKRKISKGNRGQKRTIEARLKISKALKGKPKSQTHCKRISMAKKGRKCSDESIKKTVAGISKNYKITTANGDIIFVKNLKQFCREYENEKLDDSSLIKVAKGKISHHKGYLCEYMEDKANVL